jgi:hypothetical protein
MQTNTFCMVEVWDANKGVRVCMTADDYWKSNYLDPDIIGFEDLLSCSAGPNVPAQNWAITEYTITYAPVGYCHPDLQGDGLGDDFKGASPVFQLLAPMNG